MPKGNTTSARLTILRAMRDHKIVDAAGLADHLNWTTARARNALKRGEELGWWTIAGLTTGTYQATAEALALLGDDPPTHPTP